MPKVAYNKRSKTFSQISSGKTVAFILTMSTLTSMDSSNLNAIKQEILG